MECNNKSSRIRFAIIAAIAMLVYWFVPIANLAMNRIRLSSTVITFITFVSVFIQSGKLVIPRFRTYTSMQLLTFTIWIIYMTIIYDQFYLVNTSRTSFLLFPMNTYATFFPNLWLILFPMIALNDTVRTHDNSLKLLIWTFVIAQVVNLLFQLRAILVFPDAVRATRTAEYQGFGSLLVGLVGYAQIYALSLTTPILTCKVFRSRGWKRFGSLGVLCIVLFATISSNLATAGLLALAGVLIFILLDAIERKKKSAIILLLIVFFLVVFVQDVIGIAVQILGEDTTLGSKLIDISTSLATDEATGEVGGRANLFMQSFKEFLTSPNFVAFF